MNTPRTACIVATITAALWATASAQQPGTTEEWFKRLDRNGDGKIIRDEMEALPRLKVGFDYLDTNHDGGISLDEMKTAIAWWRQRQAEPPATNALPKRVAPSVAMKPVLKQEGTLDANSPQFRGPRGDGIARGTNLPVTWSTTTNVVWSCAIPGKGWSSPIIWGDRVFVTSVIGPGSVEAPPEVRGVAENIRGVTSTDEHQYMLHCVDWRTGRLLWSRCAHQGVPPGPIHPKNTYASETPVTDGERVYAYFGNIGLFCYDLDGGELWSRKSGSFKMNWNWGPAASPALHAGLLFVLNDNQEQSSLVALDKRTGKDVWRLARDEKSNWTTPFVWQNELRTELVTSGSGKVRSYDLNGKLLYGKQRFTMGKAAFSASPWTYDGKIFCLTEAGETYVVEAGPEFRVLHVNRLHEAALATPAIARDSLILRTLTKLYRISNTTNIKKQ